MRSMKKFGMAAAAVSLFMALGGSSAMAASFDPPGATLTAHGSLTLDAGNAAVTCTYHSGIYSPGGDIAWTTDGGHTPAAPTFTNCSATIGGTGFAATAVGTPGHAGAWTFTATSTTTIDVTRGNATIVVGGGACTISAMNVSVPNNAWSNAAKTLTPNNTAFPIIESGFFCNGATQANMTGSVSVPGATIT